MTDNWHFQSELTERASMLVFKAHYVEENLFLWLFSLAQHVLHCKHVHFAVHFVWPQFFMKTLHLTPILVISLNQWKRIQAIILERKKTPYSCYIYIINHQCSLFSVRCPPRYNNLMFLETIFVVPDFFLAVDQIILSIVSSVASLTDVHCSVHLAYISEMFTMDLLSGAKLVPKIGFVDCLMKHFQFNQFTFGQGPCRINWSKM